MKYEIGNIFVLLPIIYDLLYQKSSEHEGQASEIDTRLIVLRFLETAY
jgi:hypothetical protein